MIGFTRVCLLLLPALLAACSYPWNDPYRASQQRANIFYSSFTERPKHFDPVQAYSDNEYQIIANIYTPPLQYHYLKRPYQLIFTRIGDTGATGYLLVPGAPVNTATAR